MINYKLLFHTGKSVNTLGNLAFYIRNCFHYLCTEFWLHVNKPATCQEINQINRTMQLFNRTNREVLMERMIDSSEPRITLSFYKYYNLRNPELFRDHLYQYLDSHGVLGRIYVAHEGINGQVSVPEENWEEFKDDLGHEIIFLQGIRLNVAIDDDEKSFFKLNVKVRPKIVADGLDDSSFDVSNRGKHLSAEEVNKKLEQNQALIVDMRNHYEWEVGHFKDAILPDVETFREALPVVEKKLENEKGKPIIMYCTGGIRCEKASAYYKHKGFQEVYMIDGGIIEYARQCEKSGLENKFIGKNFVFDERLGERISDDVIARCHQCGKECDAHKNCANDACHILFIQCEECAEKYENCCSIKCAEFNALPEEEQRELRKDLRFNGTDSSKGRYNALSKDEHLKIPQ